MRILDPNRLSRVPMTGIRLHWTGGGHKANAKDLSSYHGVTEGDGRIVYGVDIARNSGGTHANYAAHTRNNNTNNIGHSMAGMLGATEAPWNPGSQPLTSRQWDATVLATADYCEIYKIGVARNRVCFHAEVPLIHGIAQPGKWDVIRLPFDDSVRGALAIGDKMRDEVLAALRGSLPVEPLPRPEPLPAGYQGGTARVTVTSLNTRSGPGTSHAVNGSLPMGTVVTVLDSSGDWLFVRSPAGYERWVHGGYIQMVDTAPAPGMGSVPDPLHADIARLRDRLDLLNEDIPADRDALAAFLTAAHETLDRIR